MNNSEMPDTLFEVLEKYLVEVPKVQRDYAQGRADKDTDIVRHNLLSDIKASVLRERPPLDFELCLWESDRRKQIHPDRRAATAHDAVPPPCICLPRG